MKTLTVYYSMDGNTRRMAECVAGTVGGDLLELKPVSDVPATGPMKIIKGGFQAVSKKKPALQPFDRHPADYDFIFVGSPVWAGVFAPALRTFFVTAGLTRKKVALFFCHGGGGATGAERQARAALAGNECVGVIAFRDPLKKNREECERQAREWAAAMCRES
jgi:flavodoxin